MQAHLPVMLEETLTGLSPRAGGIYVDATFGRGGHSRAILERIGPEGTLHAIDRDPAAETAASALAATHPNFRFQAAAFDALGTIVQDAGLAGHIDGVLLDLGVSSPQFDDPARGFSFTHEGPLDMRMDPTRGEPASAWLRRAPEKEIADTLWTLGEERNSRHIARAIVQARGKQPLATTTELAGLILSVHRGPRQKIHPATRSFQAIRLHVNQELAQLTAVLPQAVDMLAPAGRIAVISFHSLEDRIAKRYLRDQARVEPARLTLIGRAQFPSAAEVAANPRARSAVLRVAEKI
jgi:16S rRNA (cytosine1402-N4)-methyltransferase